MKRKLRKSIKPIIGSFLISITLWFMVTTAKEYTSQIRIPLEIERLAKGKTLLKPVATEVSIEIRGTGQSLIALYFYDSNFRLVLPDVDKSTKIDLSEYLVFLDIPSRLNLEVLEILEPKTLDLIIDDYVVNRVPVYFAGKVITEPGYVVLDTSFSSDSVQISGPKSILDTINSIGSEKLLFEDKKYTFNNSLILFSPFPELIQINPKTVDVQFEIQRIVEKRVFDIPIRIRNIPDNLIVESIPPFLSLRIKGGEANVKKTKAEDILAEIDFKAQYNPEQVEYPVSIKTPSEISWLESSPKTFKLTVKRKQ